MCVALAILLYSTVCGVYSSELFCSVRDVANCSLHKSLKFIHSRPFFPFLVLFLCVCGGGGGGGGSLGPFRQAPTIYLLQT